MKKGPKHGEFSYPSKFGFSGSAGKTIVKGYARGGATAPEVAKKLAAHAALPASKAHGKAPRTK
jgi:hypothetical protein